ncbi:MAG: hypothetical protein IAE94_12585 [Chthoniobacterales bacterium]|nr:hypothetical protein [Chthoniobacterales bacterium]
MVLTPFQTPDSEIDAYLDCWLPPYETPSCLPPEFVAGRFAAQTFDQSLFHHPRRDFASWREAALRTLRQELIFPDALGTPSEPVLRHRDDSHPDHLVEEWEITVTPPLRAPATVVIPRNGTERHPAIVALHSMGGHCLYGREKLLARRNESPLLTNYRQQFYGGKSLQAELARAGYLSIAIDAVNFGERLPSSAPSESFETWRRGMTEEDYEEFIRTQGCKADDTLSRSLLALGFSTAALVATDDLRTVDYLISRPDVDAGRIGCMGLSFGAFRTNYLAALDPRIKAGVSVCWLSTLAGVIEFNLTGSLGFFALPPGFYRRFDLADIPAMIAPKPFLAISGWNDPMIQPAGMAQAHRFFRRVWEQAGNAENLGSLLLETGHVFNTDMQHAALAFLQEKLPSNL